ncbi:hypothetical protein FQN54_004640 [Arachnomyces sp. PD_36]|nr:hypothetical protein FQN54_004640 [Arachnomyces sp. PD_36]
MVNLIQRMRKLNQLLSIRLGPGAAILPSPTTPSKSLGPITRLHLSYAQKIYGGHHGARKFWRICLPRLKYHNPAVPMTVKQTKEPADPAVMSIYYNTSSEEGTGAGAAENKGAGIEDANAPKPGEGEAVLTLDMKNKTFEEVWRKFRDVTGAKEVQATEADKELIVEMEAHNVKAHRDREIVRVIHKENKDRERMLQEAKGMVEKMRAE